LPPKIKHFNVYDRKSACLELIQKLPDEVSYEEIARKIELITGIREAQEQSRAAKALR